MVAISPLIAPKPPTGNGGFRILSLAPAIHTIVGSLCLGFSISKMGTLKYLSYGDVMRSTWVFYKIVLYV